MWELATTPELLVRGRQRRSGWRRRPGACRRGPSTPSVCPLRCPGEQAGSCRRCCCLLGCPPQWVKYSCRDTRRSCGSLQRVLSKLSPAAAIPWLALPPLSRGGTSRLQPALDWPPCNAAFSRYSAPPACRDTVQLYQQLYDSGLQYGPSFRLLRNVHVPESVFNQTGEESK
jgi:hypothetical protein